MNCHAFVEGPYSIFISSALRARRFAESQTDTPAVQRKRTQQQEQRSDQICSHSQRRWKTWFGIASPAGKPNTCSGYHRRRVRCPTYLRKQKRNGP